MAKSDVLTACLPSFPLTPMPGKGRRCTGGGKREDVQEGVRGGEGEGGGGAGGRERGCKREGERGCEKVCVKR